MEIREAAKIRDYIVKGEWALAGNYTLTLLGQKPVIETKEDSLVVLRGLLQHLLDSDLYLHAATLLWGEDMFCAEPESVQRVVKAIHESANVLLMGSSSMSKTYSAGGYMLLDYIRDPWYTTVKLASINEDHLKKNVFAHVVTLFRAMSIPPADKIEVMDAALWIGIKEAGMEFGISGIAFKQSQEASGQFKGYKAKPVRKTRHPRFGIMSRLRVLGDEGSNWPGGPFKDFNTIIASKTGNDLVKIVVTFNPESTSQLVVQMAEPPHGWVLEDLDKLYDYESAQGWRVCRLDAARSENVIQRKVIYPGLQTYEGYMSYLKAGGDGSANFFTFARGFPPLKGTINTIIPPANPQKARGEATFVGVPIDLAAVDLAYQGNDTAQMAIFRWGLASGYRDESGQTHIFKDRLNIARKKPRHVLQLDQIIPLEKHDDYTMMAEEIIGRCSMLGISPEWTCVDSTGIGAGTYGHLAKFWGDVLGVAWNTGATEMKILNEDKKSAKEVCDGVMSEMWWSLRQWMNPVTNALLINPIIPPQPLQTQMTSRRYKTGKNGIKVESKEEYKARNQRSPDESDAVIMGIFLVRSRGGVLPGASESEPSGNEVKRDEDSGFVAVTARESLDLEDSICKDGVDG